MSKQSHRRHEISDQIWKNLSRHVPGSVGKVGRPATDNRLFINAVLWVLRTGSPRRDLPPDYGSWNTVHRRFCRWRDKGVWEKLLETVIDEPDYEWIMIDGSHIKGHPHAAGVVGGNHDMRLTKGGSIQRYIWPWIRLVIQSELLLRWVPPLIAQKLRI